MPSSSPAEIDSPASKDNSLCLLLPGGGGGWQLGSNHARMCVLKSEDNGFFFRL